MSNTYESLTAATRVVMQPEVVSKEVTQPAVERPLTPEQAHFIAVFVRKVATLETEKEQYANVLLGAGYIVTCAGLPLRFEIVDNKACNPKPCATPGQATRFTKRDARHVAAMVQNGNDEHGRVVGLHKAIDEALESNKEILETMKLHIL